MVFSNFLCAVACTSQSSEPTRRNSRAGSGLQGRMELQVPMSLQSCAPLWLRHRTSKRHRGGWR